MTYEFEGKTEREAIDIAVAELGLEKDQFDVEILEIQKNSLFKKGYAKIKVHVDDSLRNHRATPESTSDSENKNSASESVIMQSGDVVENAENVRLFVENLIENMGIKADVSVISAEEKAFSYRIETDDAPILIGKKGKTLDALQFLANVYNASKGGASTRVLLDCENYRTKREESLVRMAYDIADKVRMNKKSKLLEPLNPYERRIIHSALNDITDIETKSEGNGLYKQVRILYRGV